MFFKSLSLRKDSTIKRPTQEKDYKYYDGIIEALQIRVASSTLGNFFSFHFWFVRH